MAHVHLEDGALSPFWVIVWSLLAAGLIAIALLALKRQTITARKLAIAAMCTAVGFAVFQVAIPVFGGIHLNLTPLIGILAGPGLGSIAALAINVFSAAVGHGGWGMIGVNTIVNIAEVVLGYYGYRFMRNRLRIGRFLSGLSASVLALAVSAVAIVFIVVVSGVQDSHQDSESTLENMTVIAAVNILTGVIEGVITGYMVAYVGKVRPDLLKDVEGGV